MPTHPEVLWAQRSSRTDDAKNVIYLTINLPDIQDSTLKYDLQTTSLTFEARAGNVTKGIEENDYAFKLDLHQEIIPEQSKAKLTSRSFNLVLHKKEKKLEYWPRLTKEKIRTPFIKTDFDKWVDEDEQEGSENIQDDLDMGPGPGTGMDFESMMRQMGGGAGGSVPPFTPESDSESDDEGPPPLEEVEAKE
ncbi:hypothetical protein AX15_001181 [Amanita polypyramis BW_CC]|nr:hypothetical protein AX15_001181 [Amanita polypyramis BW_CC]